MAVDLTDPKMEGYVPLQDYIDQDGDLSSRRIRDMPYGKRKEEIQLSVDTLDFGEVGQDQESATQVIVVTNVGYDQVNIYGTTIEGDFVLKSVVPEVLLAGETTSVQIAFKPTSIGSKTGNIYFDTGDAAGDELVEFTGTGVVPGTPTVGVGNYADDAAAALGGVAVGELYHTDGIVKIRLT